MSISFKIYTFKISFVVLLPFCCGSQITVTEMNPMPKRISNNAVTMAEVNGTKYLYSFGGIDSTKVFSGINLQSYRYNTNSDSWETLAVLPDSLGKIAAGASTVKNKIYIIGGYHVFSNGNEISSNKVHVYDPELNLFLPNAANIPIAIDDQVQAVWRDSLIYVITGWSNTTNVPNVQVFNPSLNTWANGTSTPNTNVYKAFGASGTIINDTIYYLGGAALGSSFPVQKTLRKGIINPLNPSDVIWTAPIQLENTYRGVCTNDENQNLFFLGGSSVTYNYNGIAYNGSGGVSPKSTYLLVNSMDVSQWSTDSIDLPMDLRGIGEFSLSTKYIAGGMLSGQNVSNKTFKIELPSSILQLGNFKNENFKIYPNPCSSILKIESEFNSKIHNIEIRDLYGKLIFSQSNLMEGINLEFLEIGVYLLTFNSYSTAVTYKIMKE